MTIPEIVYKYKWNPKTADGARRVPFGFSPRITAVLMEFQSRFSCLNLTQQQMRNIVQKAAKHAEGVDESEVTTRGLRGTSATFWATLLYRPKTLQDILGWSRIETARKYLRRASGYMAQMIYQIFNAEEIAPPIFPAEPQKDYPLVADPQPYKGEWWDPRKYGYKARKKRAEMIEDEPLRLYHPREPNPEDGFDYNPDNHTLTGAIDLDSDLVAYNGSDPVIKAKTLDEFHEDHQSQVKEAEDYRQDLSDNEWPEHQPPVEQRKFTADDLGWSESTDDKLRAELAGEIVFEFPHRLISYINDWVLSLSNRHLGCGPLEPFEQTRTRQYALIVIFLGFLTGYGAHVILSTGLVHLETMTLTPTRQHFKALVLAVAFAAYTLDYDL